MKRPRHFSAWAIQVACLLVLLQSCTTRINWTSATPLRHRRQSAYFAAQSRDLTNNFRERRVQNALHPSLDIQSVPVIPIPLPAKSAKHHNMDVAAMSSSTQRFPDGAGVSDDELLSYFPADVLKSTAKFRPVRVRVIEHEDYIDYELAFVEEKEEGKEDGGEEEEVATAATKEDESRSNEDIDIASTERPADVQITAPSFTAVTFVNLLERARRRHHELMAAAVAATRAAPIQSTTPMTPPAAKSSKGSVLVQSRDRIRNSRVPLRSNFFRIKHSYEKKADMASAAFPGVSGSRQQRIPLRVSRTEETTTTRSAMLTTLPVPSFSQVSTPLTQPSTQPPQSNKFTNVQTVSAMVVTRNVTSTRVMTNREAHWLSTTTPATTVPPTERLQFPAAASSLLLKPEHEKLGKVLSTIKKETVFETTFPTITTTTTTTPATITTSTIASVAATTIASLSTSSISAQSSTTTTTISPTTSAEIMLDREVLEPRSSAGAKNRIPRIIEPSKWEEDAPAQVLSGQYHEIKPGQYHELNPGQYYEVNPGQYHENAPGQYHENSPGQYHETNPGQYHEMNPGQYTHVPDEKVEVEVERVAGSPNRRVYNVQSKVDQFIIGEYGTINKNSGQTLQGVRYTAIDDSSVDPKIIFDTLQKYFQFS